MSLTKTRSRPIPALRRVDGYRLALFLLIGVYVAIFANLAFAQHAGMRTHKADLGQIDQAVWNSSRGRFVEMTDNGYVATRMTDHVEPILALISPVLWLWDDVRALLLLQAVFVALGAWPLYELALQQLDALLTPRQRTQAWELESMRQWTRPLALALAIAYLLAPQLQSALLTEFHAAPLAVPLSLWAFWAVATGRWGQFAVATLLVASVKEEMTLLAAGLGVWAIWRIGLAAWQQRRSDLQDGSSFTRPLLLAAGVTVLALGWFVTATFVIVPAHAARVYGVAESGYFQRYGALGDSPLDILRSMVTRPALVWAIAAEPARAAYVRDLLAGFGFFSLLAPELLLISLPVLLANLLSAYPAQYYGEFHYSAPLVPYFAAAAAYGAARLWRWLGRRTAGMSGSFQHMPAAGFAAMHAVAAARNARAAVRPLIAVGMAAWILGWALLGYAEAGRGPWGGRYDPMPVSAHHRLLPQLVDQIPADAAITATAAVHPHVSHRRYVYQFPLGLDGPAPAEWALLDVTTNTDMAPGDLKATVDGMLASDWGVVDAVDGYLLLQRGAPGKEIPEAFFSFARTTPAAGAPIPDTPLTFSGQTVSDWPRWRQTQLTAEWRVGAGFDPARDTPQLEVRTPRGETIYTLSDATPAALLWYPPMAWQPGDVIRVTTLPLHLPRSWGVIASHAAAAGDDGAIAGADGVAVAAYRRDESGNLAPAGGQLLRSDDLARALAQTRVTATSAYGATGGAYGATGGAFAPAGGPSLAVNAYLAPASVWPGAPVDLWLQWRGEAWPPGYVPFVHLRADGRTVDQLDGDPRFWVYYPVDEALRKRGVANDWRQLVIPAAGADAGPWQVVVGLYAPATGERAPLIDETGRVIGDELVVGDLSAETPPVPDQACALIPATCASQPVAR